MSKTINLSRFDEHGRACVGLCGPFEIREARRIGDGSDGGTLDRAIVARSADGTRIIIGELWAMGPDEYGHRVSFDAQANVEFVTRACNAHGDLLEACEALIHADREALDISLAVNMARAAIAKAKAQA